MSAQTLAERVASKYQVTADGCWQWTDSNRSGYGFLLVNGNKAMAHRVVYELLVGEIPTGMQLDHLCRNKMCVNPEHLEPVTQRENILRSNNLAAQWARRTHCHKCGGEFTLVSGRRVCVPCRREYVRKRRAA